MNTLRRFGAAVRLIFPLRAATLAGRFRLAAFTSNLCKSRRTTRNQSTANPNDRQEGSRAWRNCDKSSLQSEYLWHSANRNTLRGCFHRTALSAWLGEPATLCNERFSSRIQLSILKAMASERHVVLEVAFYHSAITPFPTQSPFISVLRPSQIHRRELDVKRKQLLIVQCLFLQIAKRERCV